jgi:hypothetical protein
VDVLLLLLLLFPLFLTRAVHAQPWTLISSEATATTTAATTAATTTATATPTSISLLIRQRAHQFANCTQFRRAFRMPPQSSQSSMRIPLYLYLYLYLYRCQSRSWRWLFSPSLSPILSQ